MSDENRELALEGGEAPVSLPVGSQLKAAREKKGMSVGDIALALKLGQKQVEALENGDWKRLPGHTFIRGFVRNYARLLQIDAAPLMAQLDSVLEAPPQSLVVTSTMQAPMPKAGKARQRDYALVLAGVLLVGLAIGISLFLPSDLSLVRNKIDTVLSALSNNAKGPSAPPEPHAASQEPIFPPGSTAQQVMNPLAEATEMPPASPSAPSREDDKGTIGSGASSLDQGDAASTSQASPILQFAADQETWIEVKDGDGKILLSQRIAAGTEKNVNGQGPFSLVIGNAPGVKLKLRGRPVDLDTYSHGNVARLTLE